MKNHNNSRKSVNRVRHTASGGTCTRDCQKSRIYCQRIVKEEGEEKERKKSNYVLLKMRFMLNNDADDNQHHRAGSFDFDFMHRNYNLKPNRQFRGREAGYTDIGSKSIYDHNDNNDDGNDIKLFSKGKRG